MRISFRGPGSSVGIATGYGLDGPGIETRWGARFSAPVQTGPGAHPASCTMGTGSFPGVKTAWAWCWPLTAFKWRGQERVELYLYFSYGPYRLYRASDPVQGFTLSILLISFDRSVELLRKICKIVTKLYALTNKLLEGTEEPGRLRWSGGSMLPLSNQVRGFKHGRSLQDFSGRKNPQHAFLRKGSKAVGPMS